MSFEYDRVTDCEFCGGSGWVDGDPVQDWNGPYFPTLKCAACGGVGTVTVHMRPIDFEDLAEIAGDDDPYSAFAYRGGNP